MESCIVIRGVSGSIEIKDHEKHLGWTGDLLVLVLVILSVWFSYETAW